MFYLGILVLGLVGLAIGRAMKTSAEEEWKGEHWWRERIYGPPGYYRAITILVSVLFIVGGVLGMLHSLLVFS